MAGGRNLPSFDDLATLSLAETQLVTIDMIEAFEDEIAQRKTALMRDEKVLMKIKNDILEPYAHSDFKAAGKDTGAVTFTRDEREIKAERKKSVDWSQAFLEGLWNKILTSGDDPAVYIQREEAVTYKVSENAFKGWPEAVQAAFSPGRTVTPGATSFTIKPKKES